MLLDFSDIPDEGLALDRDLDLAASDPDSGVVGQLHLSGRARRERRGIRLEATLKAMVRYECSRCLEAFETPFVGEVVLILVSEAAEFGAGEQRLEPEEATLFYADRGRADLCEIAREQIVLDRPLKPVCGPECAGLCPTCGANRNRIECSCRSAEIDPRLAPLRAIKTRTGGTAPKSPAGGTPRGKENGEPET